MHTQYIHTYTHIHTYMHTQYIHTYIHTYIHKHAGTGVPTLLVAGEAFAGRVGASMLSVMGADLMISRNLGEYSLMVG
jgi:hypothetical protein